MPKTLTKKETGELFNKFVIKYFKTQVAAGNYFKSRKNKPVGQSYIGAIIAGDKWPNAEMLLAMQLEKVTPETVTVVNKNLPKFEVK